MLRARAPGKCWEHEGPLMFGAYSLAECWQCVPLLNIGSIRPQNMLGAHALAKC